MLKKSLCCFLLLSTAFTSRAATLQTVLGGNVGIGFGTSYAYGAAHPIVVQIDQNVPDGTYTTVGSSTTNGIPSGTVSVHFTVENHLVTNVTPSTLPFGASNENRTYSVTWLETRVTESGLGLNISGELQDEYADPRQAETDEEFWDIYAVQHPDGRGLYDPIPLAEPVIISVTANVPNPKINPDNTRPKDRKEGGDQTESETGGGGGGGGSEADSADDEKKPDCGMPRYSVHSSVVSLNIVDTPVGYSPAVGPNVYFTLTYNHRGVQDALRIPGTSLGPQWTCNWISYVQDDPFSVTRTSIYVRGGGTERHAGFNGTTQSFAPNADNQAVLVRTSATSYEKRYRDGSKEIFAHSDGSGTYPRRVYLTKIVDAVGNAVTLNYGSDNLRGRLNSITDANAKTTTLAYQQPGDPFRITDVTDPYGRTAHIDYNASGQLYQITDAINMASQFGYEPGGNFIHAMTTPYGTTSFAKGENGSTRWIEITDPLQSKERIEYRDLAPGIAASETNAPAGFLNNELQYRNTFFWNRKTMAEAPGDYTKARITHWMKGPSGNVTSGVVASEKKPLEARVWYQYQGQPAEDRIGTAVLPSKVARILDDGSTQLTQFEYNAAGRLTKSTDPVGRVISNIYDATNLSNLLEVRQSTGTSNDLLAKFTYYPNRLLWTATDAAGQQTTYTYTGRGQLETVTNAKNETTTIAYVTSPAANGYGRVLSVTGALPGAVTTYGYDAYDRLHTVTNSDNDTITVGYDAIGGNALKSLDRLTRVTYPDNTYEEITWNRLDPEWSRDRMGRMTHTVRDAMQNVLTITDPFNQTITFVRCPCGAMDEIVDAKNNRTIFTRDIQMRLKTRKYADNSVVSYTYENNTSRLKTVEDALAQLITFSLSPTRAA